MDNSNLTIIAGPCSIDEQNAEETLDIARMDGINGVRVVPVKSRTSYGSGMGIDGDVHQANEIALRNLLMGKTQTLDLAKPQSIEIARQIYEATGVMVATEIMDARLQLPMYKGILPERKLLAWQPSVNQLGWDVRALGLYTQDENWIVGIKNGKYTGATVEETRDGKNTAEPSWKGLASYATAANQNTVLIHRGFDIAGKENNRNIPIHEVAMRVKQSTGLKMIFDPSHSYGPKLRDSIVDQTTLAMQICMQDGTYLYDGILIEAGTSKTDTEQHITVQELERLVDQVYQFRNPAEL
jgi:3-deoxy-D-arabino-heptulosonate 7-phosphate (DAHP) synthase